MGIITLSLTIILLYLIIGLLFALPFAFKWVNKIDPTAKTGTIGFRLLIIPGTTIFWPLLLKRVIASSPPPQECTPHKPSAQEDQHHQ